MEGNNILVISLILKVDIGQPREIPKIGVDLKVVKGGDCYRGWLVSLQRSTKYEIMSLSGKKVRTSYFIFFSIWLHSIPYITIM